MLIYRCDITMHDYLFFATTERGKVAETGPFLHNYTLTYAFGWAQSPWRNEEQKPHYREELLGESTQARNQAMGMRYITPARLLRGSTIVQQYNTMGESYSLGKGKSIGFPDWGFMKCFRPGSLFRCYVLSADPVPIPRYVRLGKLMSKAAIQTVAASHLDARKEAQSFLQIGSPLLTWNDLAPSARPAIYDLFANVFPSRLVENAVFDGVPGSYLVATFPDDERVQFPLQMGYYGEQLCTSW
jgi:CRISPR-associated protein Csc1